MDKFLKKLDKKIQVALKKDMKKLLKLLKDEKLYGAALVTEDEYISVYYVVNTYEAMRQRDEEYCELLKDRCTEQEIADVKNGTKSFVKWSVGEWEYSMEGKSALNKISGMLYTKEAKDPDLYEEYKPQIAETMIAAYKKVLAEKILERNATDIVHIVSVSDSEDTVELENHSVKELNGSEVYDKFQKRFDEGDLFCI